MRNKWLLIAGILVILLGVVIPFVSVVAPLAQITIPGGSLAISFIIGIVIMYLGLYGIPQR